MSATRLKPFNLLFFIHVIKLWWDESRNYNKIVSCENTPTLASCYQHQGEDNQNRSFAASSLCAVGCLPGSQPALSKHSVQPMDWRQPNSDLLFIQLPPRPGLYTPQSCCTKSFALCSIAVISHHKKMDLPILPIRNKTEEVVTLFYNSFLYVT